MSSYFHLGESGTRNGAHVITFAVAAECRPVTHFFAVRIEASAWREVVPSFDFFQRGDEFGVGVDVIWFDKSAPSDKPIGKSVNSRATLCDFAALGFVFFPFRHN